MKIVKKSISLFLCLILVILPLIQKSNAVVGVDDVAITIILTLLLAMGITLVVADMKNDQYIASRTAEFLQSIGAGAQSFGQWLVGSDSSLIALKNGFLNLPETIVTKGKQFINWLVPNAQSDTIIDIGTGSSSAIDGYIISEGYMQDGVFISTEVGTSINYNDGFSSEFVSGVNKFVIESTSNGFGVYIINGYDGRTGNPVNGSTTVFGGAWNNVILCRVTESFVKNNITYVPGVYVQAGINSKSFYALKFPFKLNEIPEVDTSDVSAVIGSYDDLSELQDTEIESGGTTVINNTFYITQDGQALNPDSQSLDDVIGALQDAIDSINEKIDVIGWTQADAEVGTVQPDYTDFQLGNLDFTGLGALITTRFPFSIPWDLVRIFQLFVADAVAPKLSLDILPIETFENVDSTVTIDFADYPLIGQITRWFCIIDLLMGLVYVSKRLIWTA